MSNELQIQLVTGFTVRAMIQGPNRAQRWNNVIMVNYNAITDLNWAVGMITMTEQLTSDGTGTGNYVGSFPVGITSAGEFTAFYYLGAAPTPPQAILGQQDIYWDGARSVSIADNIYTCEGRYIRDTVAVTDSYTGQWMRNGIIVPDTEITLVKITVDKEDGVRIINGAAMTVRATPDLVVYTASGVERLPVGTGARALFTVSIDGATRSWVLAIGRDA